MAHDVFISYSHVDKAIADLTCDLLEGAGIGCWIAPRDVLPGITYPEQIAKAIAAARTCLLVLSPDSNSSRQVQSEIELAFSGGLPILPLRTADVRPSGDLEYLLAGTHWLDAIPDIHEVTPVLVDRVKLLLERYARISDTSATDASPRNAIPQQRTNLPFQLSQLVGREDAAVQVQHLLATSRLVTLTGTGGIGKTRLAIQVGSEALTRYSDGVWLVELATVEDGAYVASELAEVLQVREIPGRPIIEALSRELQLRSLLIVLDNCEHLLDAAAAVADELLRSCRGVSILATSRQPLGISGEEIVQVPSLTVPVANTIATAASIGSYGAVKLFSQRAQSVNRAFSISDDDAAAIAEVCRRLDGIPLAIELAAARLKTLSISELTAQLDAKFRVLTTGSRTALPRHQTLKALIDWSYDLLANDEQVFFNRLGIFNGTFGLAAPAAVCMGKGLTQTEVLDLLASLADKSLITVDMSTGVSRYRLLESMRDYAIQRLIETREFDEIQDRRIRYLEIFCESAQVTMNQTPDIVLKRIDLELDEIRSVLDLTISQQRDLSAGAIIMNALARYWHDTGKFAEAYRWFKEILQKDNSILDQQTRASALIGSGLMCNYLDAFDEAQTLLDEALAAFRRLGDRAQAARCLNGLGVSANYRGDHVEAERLFNACLTEQLQLGQDRGVAISLMNLGATAQQHHSDPAIAERYYRECLVYAERLKDKPIVSHVLAQLSILERDSGNLNRAIEFAEESLRTYRALDNRSYVAESLCRLAGLNLEDGRPSTARSFLTEAIALLADRLDEGESLELSIALTRFASVLVREERWKSAAEVVGFADHLRSSARRVDPAEDTYRATLMNELSAHLRQQELDALVSRGRTITLEQARALLA